MRRLILFFSAVLVVNAQQAQPVVRAPDPRGPTAGQVLISNGPSANPSFADPIVSQANPAVLNGTMSQGFAAPPFNAWPFKLFDVQGIYGAIVTPMGALKVDGSGTLQPSNITQMSGVPPLMASLANLPPSSTLTSRNEVGAQVVEKGSRWFAVSNPAAGSQASASIAAESAVRHVADCVSFSAAATTAPAMTALTVNLRDGSTGAGTLLWTKQLVILNTTGQLATPFAFCGLNLVGSTNTAMTLEFSASLANLIQEVSLSGLNVN